MKVAVLLAILLIAFCSILETKGSNNYGGIGGWRRQPSNGNVWRDIFGTKKKQQDDDDGDDDSTIYSPPRPPQPEITPDPAVEKLLDGMTKYQEEREEQRSHQSPQQRDQENSRLSGAVGSIARDAFDPDFVKKYTNRIMG